MLDLLRRQATLYTQLEALGKTQQALISADDTQPLLRVLAQRQRITAELATVAQHLRPMHAEWDRLKVALNDMERRTADELVGAAKVRISRLIAADEEDARRLQIRKQRTGEALRAMQANRQAVAAYGGGAAERGNCLDRMHEDA
jgi:hypothetical protein